jgi:hypothetical protein
MTNPASYIIVTGSPINPNDPKMPSVPTLAIRFLINATVIEPLAGVNKTFNVDPTILPEKVPKGIEE